MTACHPPRRSAAPTPASLPAPSFLLWCRPQCACSRDGTMSSTEGTSRCILKSHSLLPPGPLHMPSCCLEAPRHGYDSPSSFGHLSSILGGRTPLSSCEMASSSPPWTLSFPGFTFTHSSKRHLTESPICWLVCLPPLQCKLQDSRDLAFGIYSWVSTTEDNAQQAVCLQQMWVMNESTIITPVTG